MINKVRGTLSGLSEGVALLDIGAFEIEVFVPEFVRRQLQGRMGEALELLAMDYLEGDPQRGKVVPRVIGFLSPAEREFFEMICSVDGVGVKKALRAMVRPVREIATAIEEQDAKQLSTLPGIGAATAERIVAKLRRKMAKFALMVAGADSGSAESAEVDLVGEAHEALIMLGHTPAEAREKIEGVLGAKKKFKSVEDLLRAIYQRESGA